MIRHIYNKLSNGLTFLALSAGKGRSCPVCQWSGHRFALHGASHKRRYDSRCPRCGALERHRLAHVVVTRILKRLNSNHGSLGRVLHVAPEPAVEGWLKALSTAYLSIDLYGPAMMKMDLTKLEIPDASFDFVWCSHVLEHIPDDQAAMREMHRVLAPGGMAIVQVPIWRVTTLEDPSIVTDAARKQHYYQKDHVRLYGLDIGERLARSGFRVEIQRAQDLGPELITKHALAYPSTCEVLVCHKD